MFLLSSVLSPKKEGSLCIKERHGVNIEAKDNGQIPLIIAAIRGHEEIVQMLLDNKANTVGQIENGNRLD